MNKKGLIAVIVIIILVIVGYLVWGKSSSSVPATSTGNGSAVTGDTTTLPAGVTKDTFAPVTKATADTTLLGRLKGTSVAAAETGSRVALVNGKAQFSADGAKGTITLGDIAVSKTVNGAGYAVATLAVTTDGSAPVQYVVLFQDNGTTLTDASYALIGSNAQITGLRADEVTGGLLVTVTYTVGGKSMTKILTVENGAFNSAKEINF